MGVWQVYPLRKGEVKGHSDDRVCSGISDSGLEGSMQRRLRRSVLGCITLCLAACGGAGSGLLPVPEGAEPPRTAKALRNDPNHFQFAIVGDRTGNHRRGVFSRAMDQVNQLQPEFVLCVGDLIEGYTEDREVLRDEWEELEGAVDTLDMPFFYTVGNHDVSNAVMLDLWHARRGRDYWAFRYRDVLFVSLNTEDPPIEFSPEMRERQARMDRMWKEDPEAVQEMLLARAGAGPPEELPSPVAIGEAQVAFVRETLAAHPDVRWTFLLMHKPAWRAENPGFARIEALLADRPYTAIAGHDHYYRHERRHGRDYIVMGTTGGVWLSGGPGAFDHVAWVTMGEEEPVFSLIRLDGLLGLEGPAPLP